ncbi:MAG: S1 RNA-binding domain-containing protein [Myxococcota bacterium]
MDARTFASPDVSSVPELLDSEDFAALLEESFKQQSPQRQEGEVARGRVVKISGESAFIDLGGKAEGIMDVHEFKDPDGKVILEVGDMVEATIVGSVGDEGALRLSKSLGKGPRARELARDMIQEAYANRLSVEGKVVSRNKGGYEVTVLGQRCFVPLSQMDRHRSPDPDVHVGQTYKFRISELREGGRNIVLSRAQLQKEEAEARAQVLRETLKEGDVLTGKVRSIQSFGAFVDLGGLDGLLPISELSHTRVKTVQEVLSEGETVSVQVLKFDKTTSKLTLSLKALASNPWDDAGTRFVENGIYRGKVMRLEAFGAFIELQPGLEGLLHISDMAWEKRVRHPRDVVSEGDEVSVQLLSVDRERRRLSLGMKQVGGDPWEGVLDRFPTGKVVEGTVEKVAPFGVFLTLDVGVTGLIPNSELATPRGADHGSQFPVGQVVSVQVLECNPVDRRITLSRKAMNEAVERLDYDLYKAAKGRETQKNTGNMGTLGTGFGNLLAQVKVKPSAPAPAAAPNVAKPSAVEAQAAPSATVAPSALVEKVAEVKAEPKAEAKAEPAPPRESRRILVRK